MSFIQVVEYQVKLETTISYLREALQHCPATEQTTEAYSKMANALHLLQEHLRNIELYK